ncbi:MAG: hypothetical protein J6Q82_03995 [Clostridia bacterium]|nr:hypothetical protein [Clostridia bacterium]
MKAIILRLSSLSLLLAVLLWSSACRANTSLPTVQEAPTEPPSSAIVAEGKEMGEEYLDSFVFFGESTTYHLKSRGVLRGGVNTTQVWGTDGGTAMLDPSIASLRIRYPETGELLTLSEAAKRKKPERIFLCFGLNGAVQFKKRGGDYFKDCYRLLLNEIRTASPETKIVIASCFPVAENMDMSRYSVTLDELNEIIEIINGWTIKLCEEERLPYLAVSENLKDEHGRLKTEYQNGDGHHLTREAYLAILNYLRTHAVK